MLMVYYSSMTERQGKIVRLMAASPVCLCSACGYDPLSFDVSSLSADRQELVAQAMGDWCEVAPSRCPEIGPSDSESYIVEADLEPGVLGLESDQGQGMARRIQMSRAIEDEPDADALWLQVIRHELGHAIGCRRHLFFGHVMAEDVSDQTLEITEDDITCVLSGRDPRG